MTNAKKEVKETELLSVIKNSIGDARSSVQKLAEVFAASIQSLRLEESEEVFMNLEKNFHDLQHYLEFIKELKTGMKFFNELDLPSNHLTSQNMNNLFQEMHFAFEAKDWIMLSDLIEYELNPLLVKEDEWLGNLNERLYNYDVKMSI